MNNSLEKAGELIEKYQESISSHLTQLVKNGKFTDDDLISACVIDLVNLVHLLERKQEKARAVLDEHSEAVKSARKIKAFPSARNEETHKALIALADALEGGGDE